METAAGGWGVWDGVVAVVACLC
ncbi:hypothetical protein SBDP1_640020 [Syntrophobacter sp. SbD1]|nr:hypothetical protein SBDP1_640020 [Syntrophobacter sp. SbD1]